MIRDSALTASELAADEAAENVCPMDEETFRAFYARTARPLWAYLARVSGDRSLADDLVQETYCRFFAARPKEMSDTHRKHYLFRIALNLLRDHWRRNKRESVSLTVGEDAGRFGDPPAATCGGMGLQRGPEVGSALELIQPRERELLWLAYAEGFSHKEIAEMTGLRAASLRPMLFRARKKLARLLGVSDSPAFSQPGGKP